MASSSKPPFVPSSDPASIVVPGVDPTLPPTVQIEQIDQLITDRLASIDNNMAKAHQILTTQILPSVQRFAQATQPTRDAARFWKSFFELAAQVRVPTEGDYSHTIEAGHETEVHERPTEEEREGNETVTEDTTLQHHRQQEQEQPATPQSFLSSAGQSAVEHSFSNVVSSTPARTQHPNQDETQLSIASTDVSAWSPSHGSLGVAPPPASSSMGKSVASAPPTRPTRAAPQTAVPDFSFSSTSEPSSDFRPPSPSADEASQSTSSFEMGVPVPTRPKGKGKAPDLRQKVLRRNSKGGPGTPKLSKYNPFQPHGVEGDGGAKWDGLVDLNASRSLSTDTSSVVPDFAKINFSNSSADVERAPPPPQLWSDTSSANSSSSMLKFPPPNRDLVRIAATPSKKAADLLVKDLLAGLDFDDSPGRYSEGAVPTPPRPVRAPRQSYRPVGSAGPRPSIMQAFRAGRIKDDDDDGYGGAEDDYDDDSDSFVDEGAEGGYEAQGSIEHHQHQGDEDDSFDSEDMSFNDGGAGAGAGGGNDFTDFTDFGDGGEGGGRGHNDETDTLFGPRGNPPPPRAGFRLEGPHTTRIQMQLGNPDAMAGMFSPTPFSGDYVDLNRRGQ